MDIKVVAFDADDTLWDSQSYYDRAEEKFVGILSPYGSPDYISQRLFETESANMDVLGYGAKAVCISMMETAISLSNGKVDACSLERILKEVKSLLSLPATPLPGVEDALRCIKASGRFRMLMITKGDLLDQENKLKRSGLSDFFDRVIIVSNKGHKEYADLCKSEKIDVSQLMMVGNSFKSDIQPIVEIGGYGVHIPFKTIWKHEVVEEFEHPRAIRLSSMASLPGILLK